AVALRGALDEDGSLAEASEHEGLARRRALACAWFVSRNAAEPLDCATVRVCEGRGVRVAPSRYLSVRSAPSRPARLGKCIRPRRVSGDRFHHIRNGEPTDGVVVWLLLPPRPDRSVLRVAQDPILRGGILCNTRGGAGIRDLQSQTRRVRAE